MNSLSLLMLVSGLVPTPDTQLKAEMNRCSATVSAVHRLEPVAEYDVFRAGKKIGRHLVELEGRDKLVVARIQTEMRVKLLFVTVYRYDYVSEEIWCGDELRQVRTRVDDNGNERAVDLRAGDMVELEETYGDFATTNHWNPKAMEVSALFNTITGHINRVTIEPVPDEFVDRSTYRVSGDLNIVTSYDDAGNWLGMQFRHKDGSEIEFRRTAPLLPLAGAP